MKEKLVWLAFVSFGVVIFLYAFKVLHHVGYTDFDVYYRASQNVRAHDWKALYAATGNTPFRYAPFLPFYFIPGVF